MARDPGPTAYMLASLLLTTSAVGQQSDAPNVRGPATARVTIEEFCNFQCPYCAQLSVSLRALQDRDPGAVRVVYRHFPLPRHAKAPSAAAAAACAGEQGRFWEMHDRLYSHRQDLGDQRYRTEAAALKLDLPRFAHCVNGRGEDAWMRDEAEGRSRGVSATPTMFVNGVKVEGVPPPDELARLVEQPR